MIAMLVMGGHVVKRVLIAVAVGVALSLDA